MSTPSTSTSSPTPSSSSKGSPLTYPAVLSPA